MKKSPNALQKQRNGLLAVIHIAKKDLCLDDDTYRDVLGNWGVASAKALSIREMEEVVNHFQGLGFRVVGKERKEERGKRKEGQVEALRDRILKEALVLENGEARLAGLVKAKAGVDELRWVRDIGKLRQILKILCIFRDQDVEIRKEERA